MGDAGTMSVLAQDTLTGAGVQTVTGAKTFNNQKLALRNPADTFTTTITNPAVTANTAAELVYSAAGGTDIRRTDAAGSQIIEFGPNHATGGTSILDWHTDSGDGDYRTRFIRNTGSNGIFELKQSGGGSFQLHHNANINTTTSQTRSVYVPVTIDTVGATPTTYNAIGSYINYLATQPTSAFSLAVNGITTSVDYGSGSINAKGTINVWGNSINVQGSADLDNEINCLSLYNKASNSAQASQWLTDFIMYGPVTAQPGELSGITFLMNNYYNGSPSRRPSHFIGLQTNVDTGAFKSADHIAATAYKIDYGIMIQGYAGTAASPTRGIEVGMLIGGNGANWMNPASYNSKIGTGIQLKDIESIGIQFLDPATTATTPAAIKNTAATRQWTYFMDFAGGNSPTTADIRLSGAGTINFNSGIATGVSEIRGTPTAGLNVRANQASTDATERNFTVQTLNAATDTYSSSFQVLPGGSSPVVYSIAAHKFDNYEDQKVITIPSDPASGYTRTYPKAVDANNDAMFIKQKVNGAVVEVRMS